tara:strand:- start:219 stop:362 length:144 start_codon:yes stop_codon:yes gene_type:complete
METGAVGQFFRFFAVDAHSIQSDPMIIIASVARARASRSRRRVTDAM